MEEPLTKDQRSPINSGNGGRKSILRYPLRSSSKLKDCNEKSSDFALVDSVSKRGKPPSVSQSISVLELSNKDKSDKPPRRLSVPSKSMTSPVKKPTFNITPISESRSRRSSIGLSDISKSSARRKFNLLTSASYWLQQIEVSKSAAKHSISLGFFKLALEAKAEPLQLLREGLKSYARKHNLTEYEETVRILLESYEISETLEQLHVSETSSRVPEKATATSHESIRTTTTTEGTKKLKPKSLNTDTQAASIKAGSKKEKAQRTTVATKTGTSVVGNPVKPRLGKGSAGNGSMKKKAQIPGKCRSDNEEEKVKDRDEKLVAVEGKTETRGIEETLDGNKENLDAPMTEEISMTEVN